MASDILYDDILLPTKVSDILQHDIWTLRNVSAAMVRTIENPVKFSAFTSIFISRGTATADINLISYSIKAPCVININDGDIVLPREVSDDFEGSFTVLSRRFIDAIAALIRDIQIFPLIGTRPVVEIPEQDGIAFLKFYDFLEECGGKSSNPYPFETILYSLLSFFFLNMAKYYETYRKDMVPAIQNRIADRFIRLVQEFFRKERFLDFYAEKLDITPKHLSRTIRQQTGTTAVEWISRFVILEAKVMLRSSNLNIQQIAEELNFPSQSFFGKYFKKATGLTPKEYRNSFS